jgi:hypothetical protein
VDFQNKYRVGEYKFCNFNQKIKIYKKISMMRHSPKRRQTVVDTKQNQYKEDRAQETIKNESLLQNICTLVCCYDTNGNGAIEEGEFRYLMEQLETRFEVGKGSSSKLNELISGMKATMQADPQDKNGQDQVFKWTTKKVVQILYHFFSNGSGDRAFTEFQRELQEKREADKIEADKKAKEFAG